MEFIKAWISEILCNVILGFNLPSGENSFEKLSHEENKKDIFYLIFLMTNVWKKWNAM